MGIFSKKLGIDLGTANTLVFLPGQGIVLNEPSVVAMSEIDRKVLAIGNDAKEMIGRTPENVVAYRPLKDGVIADYRVTEAMLRYFIKKALGKFSLIKPEVMISVPAGITSTERRAVIEAAIRAGARSAYVVKEPILAAIGAGIPIHESKGHMVVDLGGIVASTSVKCGGTKIDAAIADYIKKAHNLSIGEKTSEFVKISVGSALPIEEELTVTIRGTDHVQGLPRTADISTNQIVKAIDKELKEVIKAIKSVLAETPPELSADIIEEGIIMTGGSSLLRHLPALVERRTGVKASLAEEALYCVVKGTGAALEHLDTYKRSVISKRKK